MLFTVVFLIFLSFLSCFFSFSLAIQFADFFSVSLWIFESSQINNTLGVHIYYIISNEPVPNILIRKWKEIKCEKSESE